MKTMVWNGEERVEVDDGRPARRRFQLEEVCPPDSIGLRARTRERLLARGIDIDRPLPESRQRPVQLSLISRRIYG